MAGWGASDPADGAGGAAVTAARARMVREIAQEAEETASWTGRARFAPAVMAALQRIPRDAFVPAALREAAYDNRPLPIGHGQTISQPYIVALMTDLLAPPGCDGTGLGRVLEVGTGSGYQTAVLAALAAEVYSIELVPELAQAAHARLKALGLDNVRLRTGDGRQGWPEAAPFDGILVTAGTERIPDPLIAQLGAGARLVIPVGPHYAQQLVVVERDAEGALHRHNVLPVAFVPLVAPLESRPRSS